MTLLISYSTDLLALSLTEVFSPLLSIVLNWMTKLNLNEVNKMYYHVQMTQIIKTPILAMATCTLPTSAI